MEKVSLADCQPMKRDDDFIMKQFFKTGSLKHGAPQFGFASFKPGMRVPVDGYTTHAGDEFSYILSGSLQCSSQNGSFEMRAGDALHIPAGEQHFSQNKTDTECTLVYFLDEAK